METEFPARSSSVFNQLSCNWNDLESDADSSDQEEILTSANHFLDKVKSTSLEAIANQTSNHNLNMLAKSNSRQRGSGSNTPKQFVADKKESEEKKVQKQNPKKKLRQKQTAFKQPNPILFIKKQQSEVVKHAEPLTATYVKKSIQEPIIKKQQKVEEQKQPLKESLKQKREVIKKTVPAKKLVYVKKYSQAAVDEMYYSAEEGPVNETTYLTAEEGQDILEDNEMQKVPKRKRKKISTKQQAPPSDKNRFATFS